MTIPALWNAEWTTPLVNHLWQSTVFGAVAWLLALALRKNHAPTRYWVWMAASLKFLVPFWLLIGAGEWARSLLSAPPLPPPALAAAMGQIAQPFPQFPQEQFFGAAGPSVAAPRAELLPAILLAIWACGTLIVLFGWARGWLRVRAAVRAASPLEIVADIPALSSTASIEPGIFGIFRPVLLLPAGILNRLTPAQLNAIVAHEMCHVRRRDNLTFALHMIVEALFWFHPAVWWIGAHLIEERERACDEFVVQSGGQAEIYAQGILNVCKSYVESPLACVAGITGADLKKRVVRIMSEQVGRRLSRGRKLTLAVAGLVAMFGPLLVGMIDAPLSFARQSTPALQVQDITGQWQGTLKLQQDVRIVLVIAKDNGALKGTMYEYNIDDPRANPFKASSIFLDGSTFKFANDFIGVDYKGKLSADGNTIDGAWMQGTTPVPLVLVRANKTNAWEIPAPAPPPKFMPADAVPKVEVATIKPNDLGTGGMQGFGWNGRAFGATAASLEDLIAYAYNVQAKQIVGGPSWIRNERFDIVAVPDIKGQPDSEQERSIVRSLVADRFQLKFHKETRDMSAFVLTVDNSGTKLIHTQFSDVRIAGFGMQPVSSGLIINMRSANIPNLIYILERLPLVDRPVVDHTGLQGRFDFSFTFMPDETQFNGHPPVVKLADGVEPAPSFFEAMQQQLGLKLSSEKTAVDVIAIDHVEKPSPN
jgi:uncharacterized protein (TIGR03435 family)